MKINRFLSIFIMVIAIATFFVWQDQANTQLFQEEVVEKKELPYVIKKLEITDGSTYGKLMEQNSSTAEISSAIFAAANEIYDLSKIRVGRTLDLYFDKDTNDFFQLVYQIDTEEELFVKKQQTGSSTPTWTAEIIPITYEVKVKTAAGVIKTSMYEAALKAGIDERAIIDLADVFQWSVDFALDVRVDDTFEFIYEERYRDGTYVMPGRILAGKYVNADKPYYAFYFSESEDNTGYFDENGNSVQKLFLKAPVAYKYISSGFTTGLRYVQAFNVSTGHRAIDYAASAGTPVRSVGDGTVTVAGWNGSYGNFITVRHNGTYSTNYAHLSGYAVKAGQRVTQGQTIGYVGSTGFSTGPHLHYEMVKNGVKVNPLNEVLPPGTEIKEENKTAYFDHIKNLAQELDLEITQ